MVSIEVKDFNRKIRDCVLIDKNEVVKIWYKDYTVVDVEISNNVLVCRDASTEDLYRKLEEGYSTTYALGICLGYPPKCVEWFEEFSPEQRLFISHSSMMFATSVGLVGYALDYLKDEYNINLDDVFINRRGEDTWYGVSNNPYVDYQKSSMLVE